MEESLKHLDEIDERLSSQIEGQEFDKNYIQSSSICHLHYKHAPHLNEPKPGQSYNNKESVAGLTSKTPVEKACQHKAKKEELKDKAIEPENLLRGKNWKFITFQDDFLSTRTERADQTFAALVYGNSPLARLFRWGFKTTEYRSSSRLLAYGKDGIIRERPSCYDERSHLNDTCRDLVPSANG
ncbi:hypothetical protein F4815DRAFT_450288 [Daldinia loculata]|nr:hypothetical protein F4815DRAFT_450288 [Daldinia loculata]